MHGLIYTKHFKKRVQQRGLNPIVVAALLQYGEAAFSRGGIDSLVFTKAALAEIRSDYGVSAFQMCEKFKNTYIVMSDDGVLITVARSFRRTVH